MHTRLEAHVARVLAVALLAALPASAQHHPGALLSDMAPADTLVYFEWAGHDHLAAMGEQTSAFGKLMDDPEFQRMIGALGTAIRAAAHQQFGGDSNAAALAEAGMEVGSLLWQKGVAVALVGVEQVMAFPAPQIVLAVRAGDDAPAIRDRLVALLEARPMFIGPVDDVVRGVTFQRFNWFVPLRIGLVDGLLLITAGETAAETVLAVKAHEREALRGSRQYAVIRERIGGAHPLALLHVNVAGLIDRAQTIFGAMTGQEGFPPEVAVLLEETGIAGVQSVTLAEQIIAGGHRHTIYVAAPSPRKGLLKLRDGAPVTDQDLIAIPSDASFAKAVNLRLSDVYAEGMRIVRSLGEVKPEIAGAVQEAIAAAEKRMGMKIEEDILNLFGDGWVVFDAPSNGALLGTGLTLVVETEDPAKVNQLIRKGLAAFQAQVEENAVAVSSYEHAGHRINCITPTSIPLPLAPSWAFHDQRLIVAMYPQIVAQTVHRLASPAAASLSILENPDFVRARRMLPGRCSTIAYFDTRRGVADLYGIALPLLTAACSAARGEDIDVEVYAWPRREVFTRDLFGDGWACSADEGGVLLTGHGPWPLPVPPAAALAPAVLFGGTGGWLLGSSRTIEFGTPPTGTTPQPTADALRPYARLTLIATYARRHALKHDDEFPPALQALVGPEGLSEENIALAAEHGGPFRYIAGQTLKSDPDNVLVYSYTAGEGGWVLRVNGIAEQLDESTLRAEVEKTLGSLDSAASFDQYDSQRQR